MIRNWKQHELMMDFSGLKTTEHGQPSDIGLAVVLYITHDKRVEDGDSVVDVANCYVEKYYMNSKKKWFVPEEPRMVWEFIEYYS